MSEREYGGEALEVVLALYAAIRDGRVADVRALTSEDVACFPLLRPGLSVYEGHGGMARLVADMHAVHGDYRLEFGQVRTEPRDAGTVLVRVAAVIVPGPGRGGRLPVTTAFTVTGGLVTALESEGRASEGTAGTGEPAGEDLATG